MEQETQKPFGNAGTPCAREAGREEWRADYRKHLQALKRSPATINSYTGGLKTFFAFLDRRNIFDLRAVRRADIEAYQAALLDERRYSPHTIHVLLRAVRRFYDYLEKTGRILLNPAAAVAMPKLGDRLPRTVLTPPEMRRLLDAPDTSTPTGIRDKTLLEVFYSTGIRLAELCALTIHDADVNGGFLRVNGGKGAKDRVVPMGRKASAYVKEYLRHVRGPLTKNRRDERALFVGRRGKRIHPLIVERLVRDYARAAGLKKPVTPHVFRHTCATHLLAGGADVAHVQRLLGHASITTTQIYTRVARREIKRTHEQTHPRERDREA
jgi:integrase/recombinase XerD